jgi:hypothetical protein
VAAAKKVPKMKKILAEIFKILYFGPFSLIVTASILTEMEKPGLFFILVSQHYFDLSKNLQLYSRWKYSRSCLMGSLIM